MDSVDQAPADHVRHDDTEFPWILQLTVHLMVEKGQFPTMDGFKEILVLGSKTGHHKFNIFLLEYLFMFLQFSQKYIFSTKRFETYKLRYSDLLSCSMRWSPSLVICPAQNFQPAFTVSLSLNLPWVPWDLRLVEP